MTKEDILAVVKPVVCAQLKSPASAQFPTELISIVCNRDMEYHVEGFVDSQNSYGAMLRNDLTADVSVVNGVPRVTSCTVGARTNVQSAKEFGTNYIVNILLTIIGGAIIYFIISVIVGF